MKNKNEETPEAGVNGLVTPAVASIELNEFEKDAIGNFVLKLYHGSHIQTNGLVLKKTVQRQFMEYLRANSNYEKSFSKINIGTLMRKCNFLFNTPRGSDSYCIGMRKLFEFRNEKLKQFDAVRLCKVKAEDPMSLDGDKDKPLEETIEISPDAEEFPVVFQGGCVQEVLPNFTLTSLGCYICQKNFKIQSDFEEHVSTHGFETDFEFLSSCESETDNIFQIIYRLCNESHYFNFTMKTTKKDIIVEKIIIVQTRLMHYVKNNKVPYEIPPDGIDSFFVDSHLFTIAVEQPIVVVYRHKSNKTLRFIEQHHFLNTHKPRRKRIRQQLTESSPKERNNKLLADDELWKSFEKLMQRINISIDSMLSQLDDREEHLNMQRTDGFPQVHFPIRACRLPHDKIMKNVFKLDSYDASKELIASEKAGFPDEALCNLSNNIRNYIEGDKVLNSENICDVLRTLLHIEDLEAMQAYASLRQKAIKINRFGNEYSVRFKKLPKNVTLENIVSPMDEILLTVSEPDTSKVTNGGERPKKEKVYFAIVERVYYNQVCFKYDNKPAICENKLYDIKVRPSRLSFIYQFRAISMLNVRTVKYLLPRTCNLQENNASMLDLELFNPSIEKNPEQLQAVRNIADGPSSVAPYVIFGPPGTGKTSTVVEAVLQLWKRRPETRILITAGSNSACDEVAIRLCRVLIDLQPDKMNILRIFAKSNEKRIDSIDDILIEASNFYRTHFYPAVEVIREYRIVVCTLSVVGKLVTANIGANFFTHIFMDECAASTVPEVLVGWMGTSSSKTRLIISGDHKQLGPIIKSKRAASLGLSVSFMEQLMNMRCYAVDQNGQYNRSIQTRLIRNYRSHPEIVGIYNRMYYNNELRAMANEEDMVWGLNWHLLPNKTYPIVFHSVYGNSRKINNSVSLCNEQEVNVVLEYVKDLLYFGIKGRKIEETDIGIISPYKKQYIRIQEELNARRWHQIEVGAVETFQGKEKAIIIVSTVRSFTKTLGFLDNPRRLNVILSRPKSLLIMVGNPKTLSQSEDFKHIIDECRNNKSTVGGFRGYDEKPSDENLENDLKKLSLDDTIINNFIPGLVEETRKSFKNKGTQKIGSIKSTPLKPKHPKAKAYKHKKTAMPKNKGIVDRNNEKAPDGKDELNLAKVAASPKVTERSSLYDTVNMRSTIEERFAANLVKFQNITSSPSKPMRLTTSNLLRSAKESRESGSKENSRPHNTLRVDFRESLRLSIPKVESGSKGIRENTGTLKPTPTRVAESFRLDLGIDSPRPSFVNIEQSTPKVAESLSRNFGVESPRPSPVNMEQRHVQHNFPEPRPYVYTPSYVSGPYHTIPLSPPKPKNKSCELC